MILSWMGRTGFRAIQLVVAGASATGIAACGNDSESKPGSASPVPVESTTVATTPATAGVRVLILGTSLTAGMGVDPDSAFPAALQRLADSMNIRTTIVAAGISGETSAGALRRVEWLMKDRVDVVVIETGANDGLRGLDPDTTRANIKRIIGLVRQARPDARILLAQMEAPPNIGQKYTRDFHDLFLNVAAEEAVPLIPFFLDGVAGVDSMVQADGIHPNEAGARRAARNMWRTLAPVIREVPGALPR
jgi:acyl-CoA thioesterase-1